MRRILVKCVDNRVLLDAYQNSVNHQYVYYQHEKDKSRELVASLDEHKRICDCLKAGDEAAVRDAIMDYLKIREEETFSAME